MIGLAGTYVIPDRHDKDHGVGGQGRVDRGESSNLTEAVSVTKGSDFVLAVLRGDRAAVGEAIEGRGWDVDGLAVLDKKLGKVVLGESSNDGELLAGVDSLALSVEVGDTVSVWVVVATVGITVAGESICTVSTTTAGCLANVVGVVFAGVRGQSKRVRVGFPVKSCQTGTWTIRDEGTASYQTSISAQQAP